MSPERSLENRRALACAFIANLPTTRHPIDRLKVVAKSVRLVVCRGDPERGDIFTGVCRVLAVPSSGEDALGDELFGHVSPDSMGRKKPAPKLTAGTPKRTRGRTGWGRGEADATWPSRTASERDGPG